MCLIFASQLSFSLSVSPKSLNNFIIKPVKLIVSVLPTIFSLNRVISPLFPPVMVKLMIVFNFFGEALQSSRGVRGGSKKKDNFEVK